MKVLYLAGGYPSDDNPSHGIFNERAVHAISRYADVVVIHYRIFKPGRSLYEYTRVKPGLSKIVLCIPFLPWWSRQLFKLNNYLFKFFTNLLCAKYLKRADVVHAGDATLGIFAAELKERYSYKLIVQCIGGDLNEDLKYQSQNTRIRKLVKKFDVVTCNSISLRNAFKTILGDHPMIKVVYRGVDIRQFYPATLKLNATTYRFYFLGGLPNYKSAIHGRNTKGGETLMKAWSIIDRRKLSQNFSLTFAGPGTNIASFHKWRSSLANPDKIIVGGTIPPDNIAEFHRKHNIIVIPSLNEGLPNVCLEAMATGNLVIASMVGGLPEIIESSKNGILIEPGNSEQLAKTMESVVQDSSLMADLGSEARKTVEKSFDSNMFGEKYFRIYQQAILN